MKETLTLGDILLRKKNQQKYLGDILNERGLSASEDATVKAKGTKTKGAIFELRAVCQDFRLQLLGGIMGSLDLWEACILPSLLNNTRTPRRRPLRRSTPCITCAAKPCSRCLILTPV